jgi:hypothetical protein
MKTFKMLSLAIVAGAMLTGCCTSWKAKCYPYPVYDYSPARACAAPCAAPCAVKGK